MIKKYYSDPEINILSMSMDIITESETETKPPENFELGGVPLE